MQEKNSLCVQPPQILKAECFQGKVVSNLSYAEINDIIRWSGETYSKLGSGGIASFIGYVKGFVDNKKVLKLKYEAYEPHASRILDEIAKSYLTLDYMNGVIILQNTGILSVGEPTILVISAAKNRKDAFRIAMDALEKAKHMPPIFKLEYREDGKFWVIGDGQRLPAFNKEG